MTPLECVEGLKNFLDEVFADYDEHDEEEHTPVNVYAGFLPYANTRETKKKLCPAVVIRPAEVVDGEEETLLTVLIIVTTFDEDMIDGAQSMFHMLEFLRLKFLEENPIKNKWQIKRGSMDTFIPGEQPYPQWWGQMEFTVNLPQPENHQVLNGWEK